jgi:hypothetical protein
MMSRLLLGSIAIAAVCLSGCGSSDFDADNVHAQVEGTPQSLSNEQVVLTEAQVDCGARNDLWDAPTGNLARLAQKGRDLKFTDDVRLNDPEIHSPYTQVSGTFQLNGTEVIRIRDEGKAKLADVKTGVVIAHECFSGPLPLMGVRKGKFAPDAPVVFRFQGAGKEWSLDKLMH